MNQFRGVFLASFIFLLAPVASAVDTSININPLKVGAIAPGPLGSGSVVDALSSCGAIPPSILNSSCRLGPIDEADTLDCKTFGGPDKFNEDKLTSKSDAIKKISDNLEEKGCAENKMEFVQKQLTCIQKARGLMSQSLSLQQKTLQNNMAQWQAAVSDMQSQVQVRNEQVTFVDNKMGETAAAIKDTGDMVAMILSPGTGGAIASTFEVDQTVASLALNEKKFQDSLGDIAMARAVDCFKNKPDPNSFCTKAKIATGGKATQTTAASTYDCVLARTNQYTHVVGGQVVKNEALDQTGNDNEAALRGILDQVFAKTPTSTTIVIPSSDPKAAQDQADTLNRQAFDVRSFDDFYREVGSTLESRFGSIGGQPIGQYVNKRMKQCYSEGQRAAQSELKGPRGLAAIQIQKQNRQALTQRIDSSLSLLASRWSANASVLTSQYFALPIDNCMGKEPGVGAQCYKTLATQVRQLMDGSSLQSQMRLSIPSTDTNGKIGPVIFNCMGLKGCGNSLKNLDIALRQEKSRIEGHLANTYIPGANTQFDKFQNEMKSSVATIAQDAHNRIDSMNKLLASMGMKSSLKAKDMEAGDDPNESERLKPSTPPRLRQMPNDLFATLAGNSNPKMPELNSISGDDAIAEARQKIDDARDKANAAQTKLASLEESCKADADAAKKKTDDEKDKKDLTDFYTTLWSRPDNIQTCYYEHEDCKDTLNQLVTTLETAFTKTGKSNTEIEQTIAKHFDSKCVAKVSGQVATNITKCEDIISNWKKVIVDTKNGNYQEANSKLAN